MNQLLLVVTRQTNLKVLRIGGSGTEFPDVRSSFKKKLLQNHRKLEVVSLNFDRKRNAADEELHDDEFVEQLVQTNPNIRVINSLYLTEKGIQSLCSLSNLKKIGHLRVSSADQIIPTVRNILTGNSRDSLQSIEVGLRNNLFFSRSAIREIGSEVDPALQEAGFPFKTSHRCYSYLSITRIE